jgi:hypothetical protein
LFERVKWMARADFFSIGIYFNPGFVTGLGKIPS